MLTAACVKLEVPVKVTVTLGIIRSLASLTVLPLTSRNTKPESVEGVDRGVVSVDSSMMVPVPTASPSAALRRIRKHDRKRLVPFLEGIAHDLHGDRGAGHAWREGDGAAGHLVVVVGQRGGAIGRGVLDGDVLAAGGGQADGEHERSRAAVPLRVREIAHRDGRHRIVVDDRARGVDGGDIRVARRQVQREGFVGLVQGVAVDQYGDELSAGLPGGERERADGGDIIAAGHGGAVGRGVSDRHLLAAGIRQRDGEHERRGAGVALVLRDVADDDRGHGVVIADRAQRRGIVQS